MEIMVHHLLHHLQLSRAQRQPLERDQLMTTMEMTILHPLEGNLLQITLVQRNPNRHGKVTERIIHPAHNVRHINTLTTILLQPPPRKQISQRQTPHRNDLQRGLLAPRLLLRMVLVRCSQEVLIAMSSQPEITL